MLKPSIVLTVIATLFLTGCSSTPKGVWSPHGKWSAVTPVEYAEEYCDGYADMAAELSVAGQQVPQPSSPQATRTTCGYDVKAKCKRDAFGNYECTGVAVPNVQSTLANSGAQVGEDIGFTVANAH